MHSQKLHILNIPELDKIIIEIKDYFNYEVNYFKEKKDLIKKIEEDNKFLENSIILVDQRDFSSLKNKTNENFKFNGSIKRKIDTTKLFHPIKY